MCIKDGKITVESAEGTLFLSTLFQMEGGYLSSTATAEGSCGLEFAASVLSGSLIAEGNQALSKAPTISADPYAWRTEKDGEYTDGATTAYAYSDTQTYVEFTTDDIPTTEPSLSPESVDYDKATATAGASTTLALQGNTVNLVYYYDIMANKWYNIASSYYTVSGSTYTFSQEFLNSKPLGNLEIRFGLSSGETLTFLVNITDSRVAYAITLSPARYVFSEKIDGYTEAESREFTVTNVGKKP